MNRESRQNVMLALCLLLPLLVGTSVLTGWIIDVQTLKSILPGLPSMKVNTAVCMILTSLSVIILSLNLQSRVWKTLALMMMLIVGTVVTLTILQYFTKLNFNLDQFLLKDTSSVINAGRMSPTTAYCFLNITIATLLLFPTKIKYYFRPIAAALSATVILIAGLIFIGYLPLLVFGLHIFTYAQMSIHTALAFTLLGFSLLILIKREGDFAWTLNAVITSGCVIWLLSMLGISFAYYNSINQIKRNNEQITQSKKIIKELGNIVITLEQFEVNERNYLKTGDKKFLENRTRDLSEIHKHLNDADKFIVNNSTQESRLNELRALINKRIEVASQGENININEVPLSNKFFEVLTALEDEENKVFSKQEHEQNILLSQTLLLSPLGIFLSISILFIGLFVLNANILERKKIINKLKRLAEIVESSDDGIIGKSLNSIVTTWNAGAERIFGYKAEEMIGKSIAVLIPEDRIGEEAQILNKIKNGEIIEHFETVRIRKDGKPINVSVTISPIKNAENEIIGASKIVRDITDKKHMEQQLHQSEKMIAIGQLTGGVAHDFNNLLGIILGNLDLLERKLAGDEEALKRIKNAINAGTRGADLTKRLLAFSRMQHLHPKPTNLTDSINNVVEMAKRILGDKIEIAINLDTTIPPIMIDDTELESALLNLAINARDAMPNGGKIVFITKLLELDDKYLLVQTGDIKAGTYTCISVTDTGEGISPENLERVTEPFFTTKGRGKGTGMGLSMVYGFVKQSGGVTRIYSEVGHGTTVSLYFPFSKCLEMNVDNNKKAVVDQKFTGKALAVDDEVDLLEIAAVYLKEMGFEVFYATNADGAMKILEKNKDIRLLVTDIIMPGINGIELAKKAKHLNENVVVIYTSGFPAEALSDKSANIETVLLKKPYSHDLFISTITKAMNNIHVSGEETHE